MLHHPPKKNMAKISLHKRQRIRLVVVSYYDLVYVLSMHMVTCSFLNSAQCFGIIVTVQLQPVVESLGLFYLIL